MVCRNSRFISVCGEAVGGWLPLSCVSPPAASLQTFSNQIFSFLSQTVCVGRMSYFLLQKLADLCSAGRLVEEVVVSGCVPEPVPLAYVTTAACCCRRRRRRRRPTPPPPATLPHHHHHLVATCSTSCSPSTCWNPFGFSQWWCNHALEAIILQLPFFCPGDTMYTW